MAHGADANTMYTLPVCKSSEGAGVDWCAVKATNANAFEETAGSLKRRVMECGACTHVDCAGRVVIDRAAKQRGLK